MLGAIGAELSGFAQSRRPQCLENMGRGSTSWGRMDWIYAHFEVFFHSTWSKTQSSYQLSAVSFQPEMVEDRGLRVESQTHSGPGPAAIDLPSIGLPACFYGQNDHRVPDAARR